MKAEPLVIAVVEATRTRVASAFTEWERRYREEPGRFMSEGQKLLTETPETYGEACAPYFLDILQEQAGLTPPPRPTQQPAKTSIVGPSALIGAAWQGGIYAGLTTHNNTPMALILLPGDEKKNWRDATEWAEAQGGVLPSRFDALVLHQNLKAEFKEDWYWTDTVPPVNADFAFIQLFGFGLQGGDLKGNVCRARAVRRVAI